MIRLGLWAWGLKTEIKCSTSHHIRGTYFQLHSSLLILSWYAEQGSIKLVSSFLLFSFMEKVCSVSFVTKFTHKLFGILNGKVAFAPQFINLLIICLYQSEFIGAYFILWNSSNMIVLIIHSFSQSFRSNCPTLALGRSFGSIFPLTYIHHCIFIYLTFLQTLSSLHYKMLQAQLFYLLLLPLNQLFYQGAPVYFCFCCWTLIETEIGEQAVFIATGISLLTKQGNSSVYTDTPSPPHTYQNVFLHIASCTSEKDLVHSDVFNFVSLQLGSLYFTLAYLYLPLWT